METILSIYDKIIVKEVTFETGDDTVNAKCLIITNGKSIETELLITHTDLNRIIAKVMAEGYDFDISQQNRLSFDDGTEIIDYTFKNVFGEAVAVQNFHFVESYKQICA
jgi:hypothetical protein